MSTYFPPNASPIGRPSRRPLSGRRVLLLAALFLFVPPLGIAVLWWRRRTATVGRIIVTVLAGIWSLIWLVAIISGPSQPSGPTTVRFANVVDTPSRGATSPMSATSSTPAPLPTTSVPAAPVVAATPTVVAPPATTAEVETSAPAQQPSAPVAPVQTAPAPVTTPPAAPPPSITVVPGAYCSAGEAGQTGFSDAGNRYVCTLYPSNGRYRWKRA